MDFKIEEVKNVRRTLEDSFSMDVKFEHLEGFIPFNACKDDVVEHGRLLYEGVLAGEYGEVGDPEVSDEDHQAQLLKYSLSQNLSALTQELSVLRDADELGIITPGEKKRFDKLRLQRVQTVRKMETL